MTDSSVVEKRRKALLLEEKEQFVFDFGGVAAQPLEEPDMIPTHSVSSHEDEGKDRNAASDKDKRPVVLPLSTEEVSRCFYDPLETAERVLVVSRDNTKELSEPIEQFQSGLRRYAEAALTHERLKQRNAADKKRDERTGKHGSSNKRGGSFTDSKKKDKKRVKV